MYEEKERKNLPVLSAHHQVRALCIFESSVVLTSRIRSCMEPMGFHEVFSISRIDSNSDRSPVAHIMLSGIN